jgi:hypothetical protein
VSQSALTTAQRTIDEKSTRKYTAVVTDENNNAIGSSNLTTLTLTLYVHPTLAIVNGRNAQNVLNANGVTVDASGNLIWLMTPADTTIQDDSHTLEDHVSLFEWTYGGGAKRGQHEVKWIIANSAKVS